MHGVGPGRGRRDAGREVTGRMLISMAVVLSISALVLTLHVLLKSPSSSWIHSPQRQLGLFLWISAPPSSGFKEPSMDISGSL